MRLHQIKVELAGVRPPVWRRVLLSPEITLGKLHRVLQAVMGWEDSHAHAFVQDGRTYSDPRFELDGNVLDERSVSLGEILAEPGSRLIYLYDFGDDWKHELLCEGFVGSDVEGPYAICTDGARACPRRTAADLTHTTICCASSRTRSMRATWRCECGLVLALIQRLSTQRRPPNACLQSSVRTGDRKQRLPESTC